MTKTQFRQKVKSLKPNIDKLIDDLIEKAIESGTIDFDAWEDDFLFPKIFMCAVAKEISFQYMPHHPEHFREVGRLECSL